MNRSDVIKEMLEMTDHNLLCYSDNYLMTKPKSGYEKEWQLAKEKSDILQQMLNEIPKSEEDN